MLVQWWKVNGLVPSATPLLPSCPLNRVKAERSIAASAIATAAREEMTVFEAVHSKGRWFKVIGSARPVMPVLQNFHFNLEMEARSIAASATETNLPGSNFPKKSPKKPLLALGLFGFNEVLSYNN